MKKIIKFAADLPIIGDVIKFIYSKIIRPLFFQGSKKYWEKRYSTGGNSGCGSYNELAEFKAEIINNFVSENDVSTVIEFGCGDGNQLELAKYKAYLGLDVSNTIINLCKEKFSSDPTKSFKLVSEYNGETAELAMSLDVIFHLIEDKVYHDYMKRLFSAAEQYVIFCSSNFDDKKFGKYWGSHFKNRKFTKWMEKNITDWSLVKLIPNIYPYNEEEKTGSVSDFYIYKKNQ